MNVVKYSHDINHLSKVYRYVLDHEEREAVGSLQGKLLLTLKIDVQEVPAVSKEKAAAFKRWFET
jgi:hypothetical protein